MSGYSEECKQSILNKMMGPDPVPVSRLVEEEGISDATLYTWRNKARIEKILVVPSSSN